jgi:hypothetical protein
MIRTIFLISDLLFPVWWIVLMIVLVKKGVSSWKAWGIASTFCVAQAYLVAKFIGWNLGGYFLAFISSIPSLLFGGAKAKGSALDALLNMWFWILPPLLLIAIPMLALYLVSRTKGK